MDSSPYRKTLQAVIGCISEEKGFDSMDRCALETLTEMMQSLISEVGRISRSFCEHAGRTEVTYSDVVVALVEAGISVEGCLALLRKGKPFPPLPTGPPTLQNPTKPPSILQAGEKRPHPSHIPDYLPIFPDSHSYIRSPTHKQPVTEYEAIREKSATQKKDVEKALTRFMAKTGATQSLFAQQENSQYLLIACKSHPNPYLGALLPKDQSFDEENSGFDRKRKKWENEEMEEEDSKEKLHEILDQDVIDNPFLRPVKLPKKKKH